ncbi:MAG: M42 family metallopeptidase [Armatimonadetes bacterium]|nr:M42 family metallopeptidase [Armatimonadota bacterium]
MREESLEFLKVLVETGAPSGYEQPVQSLFRDYVQPYSESVRIDVMGNAIAALNPDGQPRVMLAGHADEIGFLVRHINDEGYLYFGPVGGWDAEIVVGQRVTVHTRSGPLRGTIGKRAIHLLDEEERRKKSELHTLWIDVGLSGREAVAQRVAIGDPVTIHVPFDRLANELAVAKSFDNRMAVFVCAETLRLLHGKKIAAGVYSVSTVQEEIGLRGARTASFGVDPQIGIAIDVTHATDYPDADKRKVGDIRIGGGPVITRGANINPRVFERLVQAAEEESIPYQVEATPGGTGTDANAMQLNKAGMATGLVSVALRYMHTPCEVLSLTDLENGCRLCAAFIERLRADQDWTP